MNTERYQRVRDLFHAVCDLDADARAAAIDDACGDDPELRTEVESLLAHHDEESEQLSDSQAGIGVGWIAAADAAMPDRIGQYRIIGKIGEGGMGTVFEAEQQNPRRTVALKVIRLGAASEAMLRRFEYEAHVLGQLQHVGIAQIYEAGTAETAYGPQPFLAMELIRGESLTEYAQREQLDVRQRLVLIARICDAVQHAHQKGVIHRDLKPANVLVVDDDGSTGVASVESAVRSMEHLGQPKVLDFGVARATDADMQTVTLGTNVGQLVGTVPYMSPEQVSGDPTAIDVRSDVYALGVMAYELLSGHMPYDVRHRPLPDVIRIVREQEATRLGVERSDLRGDVETIVAKAIEKDPGRRYQSAADLGNDIRRFLRDETILARPVTAWYQMTRFARRHRALVGGAVSFLLLLIVALIVTGTLYVRADRAELRARREAARAAAINKFLLQDMLAAADPSNDGYKVTVVDVLARAAETIPERFADDPRIAAELHRTIGATYVSLGAPKEGVDDLRRAVELFESTVGPDDPVTLDTAYLLGGALLNLDSMEEAETVFRSTLTRVRTVLGESHEQTLDVMVSLGETLQKMRRFAEAEELLTTALDRARKKFGPRSRLVFTASNSLSAALLAQKKFDEAKPVLFETLDALRETRGDEHPHTLAMMNQLAGFLVNQDKPAEAEPVYRELVETAARVMPPESWQYGMAVGGYGMCLEDLERLDEAVVYLQQSYDTLHDSLGPDQHATERALSSLYRLQYKLKNDDVAIALHQRAVETRMRIASPGESASVQRSIAEWIERLRRVGVPEAAQFALERLAETANSMESAGHPRTARFFENFGWGLAESGYANLGEPWLVRAYHLRDAADAPDRRRIAGRIADALDAQNRGVDADEWRNRSDSTP